MQWLGIRPALAYALPGALTWYGMLRAGMHPTLAGVILGLLTPVRAGFARVRPECVDPTAISPVQQLEARLHPWVAFAIMPLFALANAV
jgi:NhaA family Na+:H+ antiporter